MKTYLKIDKNASMEYQLTRHHYNLSAHIGHGHLIAKYELSENLRVWEEEVHKLLKDYVKCLRKQNKKSLEAKQHG